MSTSYVTTAAAADAARREADAAAAKASVTVRLISDAGSWADASRLLANVWGTSWESSPVPHDVLGGLARAGGCVVGAYEGERLGQSGRAEAGGAKLVGTAVCGAGAPLSTDLYSLITAVEVGQAGRGVGYALKLAQRAWGLERGATTMRWTFDPLIRRNAYFNLTRLGAVAAEYVPDCFAPLHDAVNQADLTDRLVARWTLGSPVGSAGLGLELARAPAILRPVDDLPVASAPAAGNGALKLWIPPDYPALREGSPEDAKQWRHAVRGSLTDAFAEGYRAGHLTRDGWYILTRSTTHHGEMR